MIKHFGVISSTFVNGIREIRELEKECERYMNYFTENKNEVARIVKSICES